MIQSVWKNLTGLQKAAEHLWCDFKWATNSSPNTNDLYIHYMDKSTGTPSLEEKKALPNCANKDGNITNVLKNCISTSVATVLKCMKWLYPYVQVIAVWWWVLYLCDRQQTPLQLNAHSHTSESTAIVVFLIWRVCLQERSTCCLRRTMRRRLWWRSGLWWGSTRRLRATWPPTRTEWSRLQPSLKSWSKRHSTAHVRDHISLQNEFCIKTKKTILICMIFMVSNSHFHYTHKK